jgi:1,4-dihydroxy-2-naphthoate octaprenyltransferase
MLKKWIEASRPWAFTAAAVPICVGAAYAWVNDGTFRPILFILTLIGGVLIQAGTNYINTYGDYKSGVDTVESAMTCPQLVTGTMDPKQMKLVGIGCFAVAALIGFFLTYMTSWPLLVVGILGIIGGYTYTAGVSYKYAGLGSIFVFFLMGPMMVWGSYFVQTGHNNWNTLLISIPVALLVSSILHGNDIRDIEHDKQAGISTLALMIDSDANYVLYKTLIIGAYVSIAALVIAQILPWAAALTLVTFPLGLKQIKQASNAQQGDFEQRATLEPTSAQFHFKFGLVYFVSILLAIVISFFI